MPYKEGCGMNKSEKMGMHKQKTNGKKKFWDAPSMGNPKPQPMYKNKGGK